MVMTIFDEFLASKEIALMRADIIDIKLDKKEAAYICHNLMNFYIYTQIYDGFIYDFNHA